jgi:hypothetical protein
MSGVGFKPTIAVFERVKTVPVIDSNLCYETKLPQFDDAADGSVHS